MSDALALYGTNAPRVTGERFSVGALSFTLENGGLRHIRVGSVEVIRGMSFLVRDRDWGTLVPELEVLHRAVADDLVTLRMCATYRTAVSSLAVQLTIKASPDSLFLQAEGNSTGSFETNRTGFTVLHPAALAGSPVRITHSTGAETETAFPKLIDPWQPFMDIAAMVHGADGLQVTCAFQGDTFETEDQRQWGDASFKTYNRPLALPWPYLLPPSSELAQSITLSWKSIERATIAPIDETRAPPVTFPQTAILVTARDALRLMQNPGDIQDVAPHRLLCSLDETLGDVKGQCIAFGELQRCLPDLTYDLEAICTFDALPRKALEGLRKWLENADFNPSSLFVCPSVDRQSTPPGSEWPACPPLEEVYAASAEVFPGMLRGGGMVSFFPELNRKRPPVEMLDFVSHGLCPLVHAADDLSVMETLETVPHITRSARAFLGEREYRIGPSTIAMRHNPYGLRTLPNPDHDRICMADDDPRHFAAFGAAYTIGLACALADAGLSVWTPCELYGARGWMAHCEKRLQPWRAWRISRLLVPGYRMASASCASARRSSQSTSPPTIATICLRLAGVRKPFLDGRRPFSEPLKIRPFLKTAVPTRGIELLRLFDSTDRFSAPTVRNACVNASSWHHTHEEAPATH